MLAVSRSADVPAGAETAVLGLDHAHVGKALAHERHGAVARAVVDDDGLDPAQRVEALLDPRQRVVGDDDRGDARRVSHARPPAAPRREARRAA